MKAASFQFPAATLPELEGMRRFVEQAASELGASEDAIGEMVLATNEATTNILLHGYRGRAGNVNIVVEPAGSDLLIRLQDSAPLFDPTVVPTPDVTLPLEMRAPGGLGVHMMRQFTDELRYRVTDAGQNELILVKWDVLPTSNGEV
jgi:serine/threonine-protein kinase RsbW